MIATDAVGWIATGLVVLTGIPQWASMLRSQKIDGVSPHTFTIYAASGVAWLVYAILKKDLAIGVTNTFVIINGVTVLLIYRVRRKHSNIGDDEVQH